MHREKKWKLAICVLKSEAVKNVMSWEAHAQHNAGDKSADRNKYGLERHDRGDAPAAHAEHLVQAELLLRRFMMKLLAYTIKRP